MSKEEIYKERERMAVKQSPPISILDIRETMNKVLKENGLSKDDVFVKKLTPEEIAYKRHILGNFVIDGLGDEIYQLPGGALTGKGGVKLFNEAVKDRWLKGGFVLPNLD